MVATDEALTVANNWINVIIQKKGSWGGANEAFVQEIKEFKHGEQIIGYFCNVEPAGYIVVSLRRELAPVKVYSATSSLDPESDEGLMDVVKLGMKRILNGIEKQLGPIESAHTEDVQGILEINYCDTWEKLEAGTIGIETDYQGGDPPLLSSSWHQNDPYNQNCPTPTQVGDPDCTAARCKAGCVAIAGAQIMRYWNWPPYGQGQLPGVRPGEVVHYEDSYDWPNMPDSNFSTTDQKNAVAELCYEVGIAVSMNYCTLGTCGSETPTYGLEDAFENQYRYFRDAGSKRHNRSDYTADGWFNLMRDEFNANQPVVYRIFKHAIVGDGWQVVFGQQQYHMNYGWNNNRTRWYTVDALHYPDPNGTTDDEYMLIDIYPDKALGSYILPGTVTTNLLFPYRYFDVDATGSSTFFAAGQYLQFLPGIRVLSSGQIKFSGLPGLVTRLYSRGDISRGIRIDSGAINMYTNGSIKLH
jgi:hypothetical protein